jgi:hypothetical protein
VQVRLNLVSGNPVTDHQGEGEDPPGAVPHRPGRVVDQAPGATQGGGERCPGVGRDRPVGGQQHPRGEVCQPVQGGEGGGGRVGPIQGQVDPADVVVRERIADLQQPLLGLPQRQVAGGVPGGANDLPVGVAEPKDLPIVERRIDGVGADRLVEVLGLAAARVAAGNGLGARSAGRDPSAGRVQQPIAPTWSACQWVSRPA